MAPHAEPGQTNEDLHPTELHQQTVRSALAFKVNSPNVAYSDDHILSKYVYRTTSVTKAENGTYLAIPTETAYEFKVACKTPKVGIMMVGWGGNNGSTVTAGILANKLHLGWETKEGNRSADFYGSLVMGSTVKLGTDDQTGAEINIPFHRLLPMVDPCDLVLGGWDISSMNLADSMDRAAVLEPSLKMQLRKQMSYMVPLKSVYYPNFIAANQGERADNIIDGSVASWDHVEHLRRDIRSFKSQNRVDMVIVLWTASTEKYANVAAGLNDTAENLINAIKTGSPEVSPSSVFAVASILEKAPFINGSPQNTFVPGLVELATTQSVFIGGDDFKSGQTKMKSALVDFLISAGIKLTSIASYNHLGNNDGKNLSSHDQFRSKEISKSNVVTDMVLANSVLYDEGEKPDHTVVIKYMPAVGDSKRALDEYYAEIFMGGHQTISMFNVCEDSLLAAPLIIDLVLITEMMTRIWWKTDEASSEFQPFHAVLSVLSYMLKAPITPPGTPVVNSLAKQRNAIVNIFRACVGLQPESDMTLEHRLI